MATIELDIEIPDLAEIEVETPDVDVTPSGGETVLLVVTPGPPGRQGQPGPPGDNSPVFNETPMGAVNGSNVAFGTAHTYQPGSLRLYLNGLRETHYTETGASTVAFSDPPLSGDEITVDYLIA